MGAIRPVFEYNKTAIHAQVFLEASRRQDGAVRIILSSSRNVGVEAGIELTPEQILEKAYSAHVRPFPNLPGTYTVEFYSRQGMILPKSKKAVSDMPPPPKAIVETPGGQPVFTSWSPPPSDPDIENNRFEERAAAEVLKFMPRTRI